MAERRNSPHGLPGRADRVECDPVRGGKTDSLVSFAFDRYRGWSRWDVAERDENAAFMDGTPWVVRIDCLGTIVDEAYRREAMEHVDHPGLHLK